MIVVKLIRPAMFAASLAMAVATLAAASSTRVLETFRAAFAAARALPLGSRPSPPDLEPTSLIHTPLITLSGYLGQSTPIDCSDLLTRQAETCVSFIYGPGPAPQDPPRSITITTGGPWLLLVGLSKGQVVDARWLGQK
jgi:hypothetical protein